MDLPKFEVKWTDAWLHTSCVETTDETPDGGSLTADADQPEWRTPSSKTSVDWRQGPRPSPMNKGHWKTRHWSHNGFHSAGGGLSKMSPNRFRIARPHSAYNNSNMKFCSGHHCKVWLPVHQFADNNNTHDGLDMYCFECNNRRRMEQAEKRTRGVGAVMDSFERFCCTEDMAAFSDSPQKSAVLGAVNQAILDARLHKGLDVPVEANVIYAKLFDGRRLRCNVTGRELTEECFLDHHRVVFCQKGTRLDVNCTNCKTPK